jgi:hypothetical protein
VRDGSGLCCGVLSQHAHRYTTTCTDTTAVTTEPRCTRASTHMHVLLSPLAGMHTFCSGATSLGDAIHVRWFSLTSTAEQIRKHGYTHVMYASIIHLHCGGTWTSSEVRAVREVRKPWGRWLILLWPAVRSIRPLQ